MNAFDKSWAVRLPRRKEHYDIVLSPAGRGRENKCLLFKLVIHEYTPKRKAASACKNMLICYTIWRKNARFYYA